MVTTAHPPLPTQISTSPANSHQAVSIKFWGVRGSVPTPTLANQRYGGNTVCVEVMMGKHRIIFDGGTGIVNLGQQLLKAPNPINAHILFTHTQWDRIQGFPFFQPAFQAANHFTVYGGTAPNGASIKHCLTDQMLQPHFTLPLQNMLACLSFRSLQCQQQFGIEDISVKALKINTVTEALGYRLTWNGYTLVYATDTSANSISPQLVELAQDADVLIYDGTYDDLTYLKHGQLNVESYANQAEVWETALSLSEQSNTKKLVLLHHSPVQDDDTLDQLQIDLRYRAPHVSIAHEGLVL